MLGILKESGIQNPQICCEFNCHHPLCMNTDKAQKQEERTFNYNTALGTILDKVRTNSR